MRNHDYLPPELVGSRRSVLVGAAGLAAVGALGLPAIGQAALERAKPTRVGGGAFVTTPDRASLFYKDWGDGPVILFSHGWPLNADAWESQMMFFASNGFRAIAHDRRGHGRSAQLWSGNTIDGYADDLATLIETLDLRNIILVGHSTGGGEVARYVGRHGTKRLRKVVLVSAIPPIRLRTAANPDGAPMAAFDEIRAQVERDRAQYYHELAIPFFGLNRSATAVSQGVRDDFWRQCMAAGLKAVHDGIKAQSETDFTPDLRRFDVPTLIIHGDQDQLVPVANSALLQAKLIRGAQLDILPGAPHGLTVTHRDRFNADLLAFARA